MGKMVGAIGLLGMLSLGLNACSADVPSGPRAARSQTAASTLSAATDITGGTVVASTTKVTDANGSYARVQVAHTAKPLQYDKSIVTEKATARFSQGQILAGQKFVTDFVVEQGIDSSAYDSGTAGWNAWKKNEAPKYLVTTPKTGYDQMLANHDGQLPALIITDQNNVNPTAVRDGGPREASVKVALTQVTGYEVNGKTYMTIHGESTVAYRATDADIVKAVLAANPDRTKADLVKAKPELFDSNGNVKSGVSAYPMHFNFAFALLPSGSGTTTKFGIAGYGNTFGADFLK